jgi:hypothetical protein
VRSALGLVELLSPERHALSLRVTLA